MVKGMLAARKQRAATNVKPSGQFRQLTGGLESIIDELVAQMPANVTLHKSTPVTSIEKVKDGYVLGGTVKTPYEEVVITTPPQSYKSGLRMMLILAN